MVALVKLTSVMVAVQLSFGHPPCLPVIGPGGAVVTVKVRLPFLMELAGITCSPKVVTCPGFWPGAGLLPWLVQVTAGVPVPLTTINVSKFPSPARLPVVVRVVLLGLSTNWTLRGLK